MALLGTLRHLFTPHHTNNHRAKVLHIDALLTYVFLFALFNLGTKMLHRAIPDVLGYATDIHVEQLLAGTNAQRTAAGLSALTLNQKLSVAAANKAADMFAKGYWAHNSPTGATPWEFISGAGYKYTVAGENLAKNFGNSQGVVDAWMASPTHRANIVKSSYREVGFAVVNGVLNGEETTLVVQMFGTAPGGALGAAAPSPVAVKPVEVPVEAAVAEVPQPKADRPLADAAQPVAVIPETVTKPAVSGYQDVVIKPIFNLPTVSRDIIITFMVLLMGVLAIDAWIVKRHNIVRLTGHNVAHFMFLSSLFVLISGITRGSLL